jgi:hypothetical protein
VATWRSDHDLGADGIREIHLGLVRIEALIAAERKGGQVGADYMATRQRILATLELAAPRAGIDLRSIRV